MRMHVALAAMCCNYHCYHHYDEVSCAHAGGRLASDITDALREAQQMHEAAKAGLLSQQHAAIQAAPHHHSSAMSHEASQAQPNLHAAGTPELSISQAQPNSQAAGTSVLADVDACVAVRADADEQAKEDATAVVSHDSSPDEACDDATAVVSHDSSPDEVYEGNSLAEDAAGQLPDRGSAAAAPLLQQMPSPSMTLQPDVVKDQEEQQQQAGESEQVAAAAKVLQQQEVGASEKNVCQDRMTRMDALYEQQVQHILQSAAVMPVEAEVLVSDLIDYRQVMQEPASCFLCDTYYAACQSVHHAQSCCRTKACPAASTYRRLCMFRACLNMKLTCTRTLS